MEASLKAIRTLDYGLASRVCEAVFDEISEDGVDSYLPDVVNEFWITLIEGDELIGLYRLHQVSAITYQIHAMILPEHRKQYAKQSGEIILVWCLKNLKFTKLIAEIPKKYENVYRFTKSMGFKDEGVNRSSYLKDGIEWDAHRLGQTKQEIESWLQH